MSSTSTAGGKVIGTHNGTFHCDEALAVFLLRRTETYKTASLVRSRDPAKLDKCDIVVDVGATYEPAKQRYDHHQRGFSEIFGEGFVTKLSSAGLIFKHFGKEIIGGYLSLPPSHATVHNLWLKLYKEFIEAVDANDNGISMYDTDAKPKYRESTSLPSRVSQMNPRWNQQVDLAGVDALFEKASTLTGEEFLGRLDYYAHSWLPARTIIQKAFDKRSAVDPSGQIILFEDFAPWKEHLFNIEEDSGPSSDAQKPLYIVYPDETGGSWRVQAIPVSPESFTSRKPLPEPWRGLRDQALSDACGIEGCIFIHAAGFIGGCKSQEGALTLAKKSLSM